MIKMMDLKADLGGKLNVKEDEDTCIEKEEASQDVKSVEKEFVCKEENAAKDECEDVQLIEQEFVSSDSESEYLTSYEEEDQLDGDGELIASGVSVEGENGGLGVLMSRRRQWGDCNAPWYIKAIAASTGRVSETGVSWEEMDAEVNSTSVEGVGEDRNGLEAQVRETIIDGVRLDVGWQRHEGGEGQVIAEEGGIISKKEVGCEGVHLKESEDEPELKQIPGLLWFEVQCNMRDWLSS
jgi:hypothetical protein